MSKGPCTVERTGREVIERKLLTALEDENCVAALLTKQDVECLITALYGQGATWSDPVAYDNRRIELAASLRQLYNEAFRKG